MATIFGLALWLAALGHFVLLAASFQVPARLGWKQDLAQLRPFNRKLMWTYGGFTVLTIVAFGILTVALHDEFVRGDRTATGLAAFIAPYGKALASPIGLGGGVDPDALAIGALGRFGFGFVEVGPYAMSVDIKSDILPAPLTAGLHPTRLSARLRSRPSSVWLRLVMVEDDPRAILNIERLLDSVSGEIDVVVLGMRAAESRAPDRHGAWPAVLNVCREHRISTVLVDLPTVCALSWIQPAFDAGVAGVVVRGPFKRGEDSTRATLEVLRRTVPPAALIVGGWGARSPREIVDAFSAGADLVAVDRGFI